MNAWNRFRTSFSEGEGAVIFSEVSRRYLTGFASSDGVLFVMPQSARLYLDSRYFEMACLAQKNGRIPPDITLRPFVFQKEFSETVLSGAVKTVYFEDQSLSVAEWERLKNLAPQAEWKGLSSRIADLRLVKTPAEIERIAAAQELAESAFLHILDFISPQRTEIEVAAELEYFMKKNGASAPSFETISISGSKTSLPHGKPENRLLEKNAFLTMDFGCVLDGYCSDMTRTVCLGKADEEMKAVYGTVLRAQLAGVAAVAAGKPGCDVDKACRSVIETAGYGANFGHSTGHGVGLQVHEAPAFAPRYTEKIPENAVLSVEPGIYLPGKFGVRIEDLVVVQPGGCRDLNRSPKELLEI